MVDNEANRIRSVEDLDTVVDSDSHVNESVDDLLPYIDDEQHSGAKRFLRASDFPGQRIFASTQPSPQFYKRYKDKLESLSRDYAPEGSDTDETGGDSAPLLTPRTHEADLKSHGIDISVLDPTMNLDISTVGNPRFAVALMEGYNDWLLDTYLDTSEVFKGNMLVAGRHRPDLSAEEIDRVGDEDDIVGIQLPSTALWPPAGDRQYDPIYEAAESNGLPIAMHGGAGSALHAFPTMYRHMETFTETHVTAHPFALIIHLTTLILRGVPERYPELNWVFQESGVSWVNYWKWRLDDHYLENSDELPGVNQLPSETISEQFNFTTQPLGYTQKRGQMAKAIELCDPDTVMFASDIPHPDFDPPEELFNQIAGHLDDEQVAGIMGENALSTWAI